MDQIDACYEAAISSLKRCVQPAGLKASGHKKGHHQIWARDAMIALLGGSLIDDPALREALAASLDLLRSRQARTGAVPNNVDAETLRPNFRAYADAGLWWIIGSSIMAPDVETTQRILAWYECQDVDQSGLLSMQESADWQDLFCTRGKGLYLNSLYVLALSAAGRHEDARLVRNRINDFFWYKGDGNLLPHIRHTFSTESVQEQDSLGRKRWLPKKRSLVHERYYLPWLGFRACGEWFDVLGHALAILAGVPDEARITTILEFSSRHELAFKSIYPDIQRGDPDWRDYYGMLNVPGHYHNGGIWPFIGGFWVAVLVRCGQMDEARERLGALAALNVAGGFNEWHHGHTTAPMGVIDQAWSAGMYIYAYECVRRGTTPHFPLNR